jgi:hypothetical protein
MTTALFTDETDRFPLGARNGIIRPADPISDTDTTPFGLTLRTAPTQRNTVPVRVAGTGITMVTEKVTEISTDGQKADIDTNFDLDRDI